MKKIILYVISTILTINLSMAQTESKTNNTGNMLPNNTKITDSRDTLKQESSFLLGDRSTETGDTYWTLSPIKDLYYNGGKVGIGTSSPVTKLEVAGTIKMTGFILPGGNTGDVLTYGSLGTAYWAAPGSGSHVQNYWTAVGDHIHFTSVTGDIGNSGNVGIGPASSNPLAKLHVFGDLRIEGPLRGGETAGAIKVQTDYGYTIIGAKAADGSYFETDKNKFIFNKDIQLAKNLVFDYNYTNSQINFGSAYNARKLKIVSQYDNGTGKGAIRGILIDENGHMGVGTDIPAEALDVAGTTKTMALNVVEDASIGGSISVGQSLTVNGISNTLRMVVTDRMNTPMFQLNSNGTTAGYVLTDADGNGNAQWTDLYSLNGVGTWTEDANGNVYRESGNVGIGTDNPGARLDVTGDIKTTGFQLVANNVDGFVLKSSLNGSASWQAPDWKTSGSHIYRESGNVGIGIGLPQEKLDVDGNIMANSYICGATRSSSSPSFNIIGSELPDSPRITIGKGGAIADQKRIKIIAGNSADGQIEFFPGGDFKAVMRPQEFIVGFPDSDGSRLMDFRVNGKIWTNEIEVLATGWWDKVFSSDYQLLSLTEVESFIADNSHLPDMPSEADVLQNGINLGEMDGLLLKKIEELTLYMIQQQKEIESLKTDLENFKK